MSAAFSAGRDTPRAFLERCLAAVKRHEKSIHAFVTLDPRAARKAADAATRRYKAGRPLSPVDGCPIAVKDIIATADMPTQMNSPIYKGWRPKFDAASVAALRQAGAVIVGKTVTTEFAIGRSGPTKNPWDTTRTPGGSSSAAGAMPHATAAADPLDDPPGVRVVSHGFFVGPDRPIANSVVTVLPTMTAPAWRRAATEAASNFGRQPL